jgi:hypothetical protein
MFEKFIFLKKTTFKTQNSNKKIIIFTKYEEILYFGYKKMQNVKIKTLIDFTHQKII